MPDQSRISQLKMLLERDDEVILGKMDDKIKENERQQVKAPPRTRMTRLFRGAAVIVLVAAIPYTVYKFSISSAAPGEDALRICNFGNMPVGDTSVYPSVFACLTTFGDKKVRLDQVPVGDSIEKDGWVIKKTDLHVLTYIGCNCSTSGFAPPGSGYHSISVPYAESWHVHLPDGSEVDLGPGSRLSYMLDFPKDMPPQRVATLEGEAFFDIAKDAYRPFAVRTATGVTTVLGTRFALRDYARQGGLQATLMSGAIRVYYGGKSMSMGPGVEAWINRNNIENCTVEHVDTLASLAWRSPYFNFTSKDIEQIMDEIAGWYGIREICFDNVLDPIAPGALGGGHVSKDLPLGMLLHLLESGKIHLSTEGRKIIIRQDH
ncbi:FecR family protein [Flavitalea sp. BT771]|uniref:FecR family protein n=1 Tax=Flavitalea sp. BT771 TaxID=3063329 RepID=UPI0026E15012|nr:FecR family protein [Flavitalea sp. BT771]MDO6433095.1 FecR family protein [Flavitalea sp. BT771]MDV6221629.1 FecR family protein [Flavitalea sp. BT771]